MVLPYRLFPLSHQEVTGGLSDTELRSLEERLHYLRELEERRHTILISITEQNKLTPELEKVFLRQRLKQRLKIFIYLTNQNVALKHKLRKKQVLNHWQCSYYATRPMFLSNWLSNSLILKKTLPTIANALEGARYILMELFSEEAALLGELRDYVWERGQVKSEVIKGKEIEGNKFTDYFNYQEPIKKIPSHRALALLRGQREEALYVNLILEEADTSVCQQKISHQFGIHDKKRPAGWLVA